jgi:hypothetical protein
MSEYPSEKEVILGNYWKYQVTGVGKMAGYNNVLQLRVIVYVPPARARKKKEASPE